MDCIGNVQPNTAVINGDQTITISFTPYGFDGKKIEVQALQDVHPTLIYPDSQPGSTILQNGNVFGWDNIAVPDGTSHTFSTLVHYNQQAYGNLQYYMKGFDSSGAFAQCQVNLNYFGFSTPDAIVGLLSLAFAGLFLGFILGFTRFLLFAFMEHKVRWSSLGREVEHG
jgi:hypothetical protein